MSTFHPDWPYFRPFDDHPLVEVIDPKHERHGQIGRVDCVSVEGGSVFVSFEDSKLKNDDFSPGQLRVIYKVEDSRAGFSKMLDAIEAATEGRISLLLDFGSVRVPEGVPPKPDPIHIEKHVPEGKHPFEALFERFGDLSARVRHLGGYVQNPMEGEPSQEQKDAFFEDALKVSQDLDDVIRDTLKTM